MGTSWPPEALDLDLSAHTETSATVIWSAITSGRLAIVELSAISTHCRRYGVIEIHPALQSRHALTQVELDIVLHAARGLSAKVIACILHISPSLVSSRLANAAAKVGVPSRLEIVRLAALLTQPRSSCGRQCTPLTIAERAVLEHLRNGLSNEQIAMVRRRSVRTIANQVASLLRKTSAVSRRALVAIYPEIH